MRKLLLFVLIFLGFASPFHSQNYFLNGSATSIGGDCYQLTPPQGNQNGTVWYGDQIDLNDPFELQFEMNLGILDGNGADGMCFVLQAIGTNAIGISGGGMGYLNFGTSFAIEFDTWQNTEYGDPTYDHIAMEVNGEINHNTALGNISGPVQMDALSINAEDGQYHVVEVSWDPATHICEVYFDCIFRLAGTVDLINTIFGGQNLVYFGFTGATGGSWNTQVVCLQENIISVGPDVTICTGSSTTLSVAGNAQGTYQWTPESYLDDPTSSTPIATPPVTTTYTVVFSDLCGNTLEQSVTVHVEDLEVTIPGTFELTCADTDALIISTTNFNNDIDYLWDTGNGDIEGTTTSANVFVTAPGTYTLYSDYGDACFDTTSIVVTGDYSDFQVASDVDNELNCIDSTTTILCVSNFDDVNYSWTTIDGNILTNPNSPTITVNAPGEYFVQVYLNEFCNSGLIIEVFANYDTYPVDAGPDMVIDCNTPEVELDGDGGGPNDDLLWTTSNGNIVNGQTSFSPLVNETGVYELTITHPESGCESSDVTNVIADFAEPSVSIGEQDTLTCLLPVIVIDNFTVTPSGGNYTYGWYTPDGNILNYSNLSGMASVNAAGTYILTVTNNDNGCSDFDDVYVAVSDNFQVDLSDLRFPNIVTSNGDNKNSRWIPFLASDPDFYVPSMFDVYELKIYNRWGNLVFENSDGMDYWDAADSEAGNYYYTIIYSTTCGDGGTDQLEGYIEVVR